MPCKLTDGQILEKSRERAYLGSLIEQKEGDLERKKKELKQQLEQLQSEIDSLAAQDKQLRLMIQLGTQNRLTKCKRIFKYNLAQVFEYRIDMVPEQMLGEPSQMPIEELEKGRSTWQGTAFEGVKVVDEDGDGKTNPITGLGGDEEPTEDLNVALSDLTEGDPS